MNASVFFDTTILIYAVSADDPRAAVAEDLLTVGGCISVQILNEFAAVARRKLKMSWEEIEEALGSIRTLCEPPTPLTPEIHDAALKLAAKHGYYIYDSLTLASAIHAGCSTVYSEDMHDGQKIGPLTIRNPFAITSR